MCSHYLGHAGDCWARVYRRDRALVCAHTPGHLGVPAQGNADSPIDEPAPIPALELDPDQPSDPEFDARLDAAVPDGMLTLRIAHQMWIDGAYFVDSRHKYEYDIGHVSGAAHLTAETFFSDAGEAEMTTIPPDASVVIYCVGGEQCDASHNTKALLEQFGYTDLWIMGVGFDEWEAAGLPTGSVTNQTPEDTQEESP